MSKQEKCLVLDVETCGDFACPLVYDLGFAVVVRATGEIIERHSLVIAEVFYGMPNMMRSAYYAEKLPTYHKGIVDGDFRIVSMWQAWRLLRETIKAYGIKRVYAYNAKFDRNALNNTIRVLTDKRYSNFLPRGLKVCCIWHMACQTILSQKRYREFATANGLVSPYGNLRTTAEAAYGYIINDGTYSEPHTGIGDVEIETAILHKILRQHKKVSEKIRWNCWTIPQKSATLVAKEVV